MLGLPNEPLPGQPLRASDQAAFLRYVKNTTMRSAPGGLVTPGSGGLTQRRITRPKYYQWPR
jgi:hypothetical protein